jgi:hypothetical protein
MLKRVLLAVVFTALALVGCAGSGTDTNTVSITPAQAVFTLKSSYAVALSGAVAYSRLPSCGTPPVGVPPCSDPAIIAKLRQADDLASAALNSAEAVVRSDASLDAKGKALQAAQTAIGVLTAITQALPKAPSPAALKSIRYVET